MAIRATIEELPTDWTCAVGKKTCSNVRRIKSLGSIDFLHYSRRCFNCLSNMKWYAVIMNGVRVHLGSQVGFSISFIWLGLISIAASWDELPFIQLIVYFQCNYFRIPVLFHVQFTHCFWVLLFFCSVPTILNPSIFFFFFSLRVNGGSSKYLTSVTTQPDVPFMSLATERLLDPLTHSWNWKALSKSIMKTNTSGIFFISPVPRASTCCSPPPRPQIWGLK
jgi:hypothetical protein